MLPSVVLGGIMGMNFKVPIVTYEIYGLRVASSSPRMPQCQDCL